MKKRHKRQIKMTEKGKNGWKKVPKKHIKGKGKAKRGEMEEKIYIKGTGWMSKNIKEGGNGGFRVYTRFLLRAAHADSAFGHSFFFNFFALIFQVFLNF
jgi:hypothetical protein